MHNRNYIQKRIKDIQNNILKSFNCDIEKAKSGVYADTLENKRLGRVGQKYGHTQKQNNITSYRKISERVKDDINSLIFHKVGKLHQGNRIGDSKVESGIEVYWIKNPRNPANGSWETASTIKKYAENVKRFEEDMRRF
jgi:hypothetical protein